MLIVVLVLIVGGVALGVRGLQIDTTGSSGPHQVPSRPIAATSTCPSAGPQEGAVFCEQGTDVLRRGANQPLRVEFTAVIAALEDAAAHYPGPVRAVGAGCSQPASGDGVGTPWDCEVSYPTSPPRTISYRLTVRAGGCWSATPSLQQGLRGTGPSLAACGLRVRPRR